MEKRSRVRKCSRMLSAVVAITTWLVGAAFVTAPASPTITSTQSHAGIDLVESVNQPETLPANCAGSGNVLFYGNFECGDPEEWSPWPNTFLFAEHAFQQDTVNVRQGSFSGRFEVRDGDINPANGTERAELGTNGMALNGDTRFYAFSQFYPDTWPECDTWCIPTQWAGWAGPPLNFGLAGDQLRARIRAGSCPGGDFTNCEVDIINELLSPAEFRNTTGMWHDWIVDVKWHYDDLNGDHDGHVRVYHRLEGESSFTVLADDTGIPTLQWDGQLVRGAGVQKIGVYRQATMVQTSIMWQDSACIATTMNAAQSCLP